MRKKSLKKTGTPAVTAPRQDAVLRGLMDYLNAAVHPNHVLSGLKEIGHRLAGNVLLRHQAKKSAGKPSQQMVLQQFLDLITESGWESTVKSHSQDHIELTTPLCPFGEHAAENSNYCTLHTAMAGEIALHEFGYAKVLAERGPGTPPRNCRVHIHTVRNMASRSVVGTEFSSGDTRDAKTVRTLPASIANKLSARELETLRLVGLGFSDKQIADNLGISVRTAENHVARLRGKLGVDSRGNLIRLALRHGLTDP